MNVQASNFRYLLLHWGKSRRQLCNEANSHARTDRKQAVTCASSQNWTTYLRLASTVLQPITMYSERYLAIREASRSALSRWVATFPGTHRSLIRGAQLTASVYQRSGTGNQFSNAVWAYSPQQWSTPHFADTDTHPHVEGLVWMLPSTHRILPRWPS